MNGCWKDIDRMGWRGKKLEDRDMERRNERVTENGG